MVKRVTIATYDKLLTATGAEWTCRVPDCTSTRKTGFAMMMHLKHDHEIQTQNLEIRTGHFVLKTEAASDAVPETQNGNT